MGRFYIFPIFIATFASRRVTLIATHSKSQKLTRLPIHYLYFILPFKPLINKEVIKVFQNYIKTLDDALRENARLAIRFASVPSGLRRLYMVRDDVCKDTLQHILNTLTPEMRHSFYGKNIQEHISCHQIVEGDTLSLFPCTQADGVPFDWSVLYGKRVLLLCDGLGCMGKTGRAYLDSLYAATSRENFLIVVYCLSGSLDELQKNRARYGGDYIYVSDFKRDSSPMKIRYGCQATPTCFLADSLHRVLVKCSGLGGVQEYIKRNGYF